MKATKRTSNIDIESAFVWGSWREQIQQTFDKATPLIEKLSPKIDPGYIYYLLREQTYIAMNRANADQRRIEQSWVKLCHALESFLASVSGRKTLREINRAFEAEEETAKEEKIKLKHQVRPQELEELAPPKPLEKILEGLNTYSEKYGLWRYEQGLAKTGWVVDHLLSGLMMWLSPWKGTLLRSWKRRTGR